MTACHKITEYSNMEEKRMDYTTIIITAIICATLVLLCWIGNRGSKK